MFDDGDVLQSITGLLEVLQVMEMIVGEWRTCWHSCQSCLLALLGKFGSDTCETCLIHLKMCHRLCHRFGGMYRS